MYAITKIALPDALPRGQVYEFFSGYFLDILAPIALMGISNAVFCFFNFRVVRIGPTICICVIAGLTWELVAPQLIPWSVSDPVDMLSYLLGGLLYWLLSSRKL